MQAQETKPDGDLVQRGRLIYTGNCIACHNGNPKLPGSQGPEIAGSSVELLTAKLKDKSYPQGYKPKRSSHIMPSFPHLVPDAQALAIYLQSP
jgi:mono/diheme cytochrome c family protein